MRRWPRVLSGPANGLLRRASPLTGVVRIGRGKKQILTPVLPLHGSCELLMDLDVIAFPALVVADDGWVSYLPNKEEISKWTHFGIKKYSARHVILYDSKDHAWEIESIAPANRKGVFSSFLRVFYDPEVPVRLSVKPVTGDALRAVHRALTAAIDADDDILTQWTEPSDLKDAVQKADSFASLLQVLKEKRAI
jgi:hypothetical protein